MLIRRDFDELRLRQRRGHAQYRLIGEEDAPLRHGVHVAREAQRRKIVDQVRPEAPGAFEPFHLGRGNLQRFKELQRLLQPGGDQEAAPGRQIAGEQLKDRRVRRPPVQVGLHHVDLIQVGQ